MSEPLRLGIAGLGTVGVGVVKIVRKHAALLEARAGRPVTISAVSARSRGKDRGVSISDFAWEDDPVALAKRDDVDVFVDFFLYFSSILFNSLTLPLISRQRFSITSTFDSSTT